MTGNFLLHFRPRRVPIEALRFNLTWGLGGLAALLVMQQLATGLLLGLFYEPTPVQAYLSIRHIQDTVFLGRLLRSLHHWTGHALVIVVLLHMVRVVLHRAYAPPRYWNWLIGLGLGMLVLVANFSGYLLPWDQLAYWAVTIATSMLSYIPGIGMSLQETVRGGPEVGGATLQLFHAVHTGLVPVLLLLFMAYHFWFVRKAGGVLLPEKCRQERAIVPAVPELLTRELAFAAAASCVLLLFAMAVDAPLGSTANPDLTPATVRAPWYFLGAQELLLHVSPVIAVAVLPLFIALFLVVLPLSTRMRSRVENFANIVFLTGLGLAITLTVIGVWFRGPAMVWRWSSW